MGGVVMVVEYVGVMAVGNHINTRHCHIGTYLLEEVGEWQWQSTGHRDMYSLHNLY